MPVELALYQPDIPQNTGTLLRLGACLGLRVHIIHPTGFGFTEKGFRRAAMDYAHRVDFIEHDSFRAFHAACAGDGRRIVLMTTRAQVSAYDHAFADGDVLLAGRESAGVPDDVAAMCDARVRIPMQRGLRSLNVAVASAMIAGEALRQTEHFVEK